ncbi:YALIA101S05e08614g1_1 [Yarrowia lipolytica]|nr:Autophagy-related protein 2 [Yarrowia lipolytica]SEI34699.1 YALIA101S05e08614g1_1 [Yarrowia lipolytica]
MNWIPNVQKRAFHYVLNRLALFSDLELDNMDISLGTAQKAALTNVKLDPDRVSLPAGMYMRSGKIDEVSVEMRLLGGAGIAVKIDGVHITASMKQMDVETATEHVEEFLERTTADLAASILSEDLSASLQIDPAEEPPLLGMGGSGISEALVKKVTQTVLSQLTVDVTNVHVTLFVAADDKMDLVVDEVRLRPQGGQEMALEVRGVKMKVMDKKARGTSAPVTAGSTAHATTGFTSESDSDSDTDPFSNAKKSLLQSTIFSHEEASSIYMSAIAESANLGFESDPLFGVFYVDTIDVLVFLGEEMRVSCEVGIVRASLDLLPTVILSLVKVGNGGSGGKKSRDSETKEGTAMDLNMSIKSISASICQLGDDWEFKNIDTNLLFSLSDISGSSGAFHKLQIGVCEVKRGSTRVFGFESDEKNTDDEEPTPRDSDILLKASSASFTLVLPKKAVGVFTIPDLIDVVSLITYLLSLIESKQQKAATMTECSERAGASKTTVQTNTFDFDVAGHKLYILPIRLSNGQMSLSRVSFGDVHVKGISFENSIVSVDKVDFDIGLPIVEELHQLLLPIIDAMNSAKNRPVPASVQTAPPKLLRIVEEPVNASSLVINVARVKGKVDLGGKVGVIEVVLGGISVTGPTDRIEISTVEIGRDLSDLGLSKKWLLHPLKRESNVVVELSSGQIQLITVKNCALEFYTELLELFGGKGDDTKAAELQESSSPDSSSRESSSGSESPPKRIPLQIHNCAVGLNPTNSSSSAQFIVKHVTCEIKPSPTFSMTSFIGSASLLLIDDASLVTPNPTDLMSSYLEQYTSVASLTATSISISTSPGNPTCININGDTVTLSTCADSTQTLIHLINSLKPAVELSGAKFQLETLDPFLNTFQDVDDCFFKAKNKDACESSCSSDNDDIDMVSDDVPNNMSFVESYYGGDKPSQSRKSGRQKMAESYTHADFLLDSDLDSLVKRERVRFEEICFEEDYFDKEEEDMPVMSRPRASSHDLASSNELLTPPTVVINIDLIHNIVCNFHDGYDWQYTRNEINGAVDGLKKRMKERPVVEEPPVMTTDLLFNSIYIQAKDEDDLDDVVGEQTEPAKPKEANKSRRGLLSRSSNPLVQVWLQGIACLLTVYAGLEDPDLPPGQVLNSLDVKIKDVEIIDHVPTSTWNKFLTYMRSRGEREAGAVMAHITMQNVKPVSTLSSQEVICHVTILPLRLHVDQDTLDFLTRFFNFKDVRTTAPPDETFIQKFDIRDVPVKLDYKPKKVDYSGLKSGKSTELMNFFILDESDMVLRRIKLRGITGFADLGQKLNDIWMPDVRRTQLPGVLAGVAPVRPLVNLGGGIRNLIVVPVREYKKDGRVVRSLNQGAYAFAKTTTNELVRFGAKLAVGTQNLLEGVVSTERAGESRDLDDSDLESTTKYYTYMGYSDSNNKLISLYANQPLGVYAGLQDAYSSFGKHMNVAKTAIHNLSEDISEADTAGAAAYAVVKAAPVALIRPIIGTTEAVSKTLFGVANEMDPSGRELARDKYKEAN